MMEASDFPRDRVFWLAAALWLLGVGCQSSAALPEGNLFRPLLSDPKEPRFFTTLGSLKPEGGDAFTLASVGFGETFGLYRSTNSETEDGFQVSLSGGLFSQFNLDAASSDLLNADYVIGLPISWRSGPATLRTRLYHQSSHLGDELLLGADAPERINLSFESLEVMGALDLAPWRPYAGGELLLRREPDDLERAGVHGGIEYRTTQPLFGTAHGVGGLDLKAWEFHDWKPSANLTLGLEFESPANNGRRFRVFLEAYQGYAPYGQFYDTEVFFIAFGVSLGF